MPTDKRLCTELVYGVLRFFLLLQAEVESCLKNPGKLPQEMRLALIAALYEMAWLRIPAHATVNRAVQHVRDRFGPGLAGVANGVLRTLQRRLKVFKAGLPPAQIEPAQAVSAQAGKEDLPGLVRRFAMPAWIVALWLEQYGHEETLQLLTASQQAAPPGLRLNKSLPGWEDLRREMLNQEAQAGAITAVLDCCLSVDGSLPWQAGEALRKGRASRQSAASYEALFAFEPDKWLLPIWDACAGRGGKTLALLESGLPVALVTDPAPKRLLALPEEFIRLRMTQNSAVPLLATVAAEDANPPKSFGTILVDAPCSGLGTLARHPEIRFRRTKEDLEQLAALQGRILDAVWPRLLPGGSLVYLTCTRSKAENEGQIAAFLARHPEASLAQEFQTPADTPLREFFYGAKLSRRSV
jgi:16S rRNA (cytosine967-C5)-methyltransferase